ncbi:precorrin-3B synthase [uncultured Tateyamaria sp.]|uniref:precorrin-3B synthase n=1 Tax=uncultured Tateyamaria sp. TaxID=455651 RepID=UPI0026056458|nr:precorrin-3B synthase [uncultured Tateyamaria sp.]
MSVKGWCPGAYRPMMSGDGLIVRVRPRLGRLTHAQMLGLCDISQTHGNGIIDLTSRANLQLRGVDEDGHQEVLDALLTLDLLDDTPEAEAKRNITVTPLWADDDLTTRLHDLICDGLSDLPDLPSKMGIAIDTGPRPVLTDTSADFRFERNNTGALILRADGARAGKEIGESDALYALIELAKWFVATNGPAAGRMARHLKNTPPPAAWQDSPAAPTGDRLFPGPAIGGTVYGTPFGSIDAKAMTALVQDSKATAVRVTPWRMFLLEGAQTCDAQGFVTDAADPLLRVHACPGAPACAAATVETRLIARILAARYPGTLHISGCSKGCAHPRPAATTVVGCDGTFDLVEQGHPWDQPRQRGLSATDLMTIKA